MDAKLLIYGTLSVETTDGCDSVAVSTVGCGPAGPGSSPGHGPKNQSQGMFCNLFRTQNDPLKLSDPFFRPS